MAAAHPDPPPTPPAIFATTRWSRVLRAGDGEDGPAQEALEELCRDYWRPLFHFACRRGQPSADAQDLTQGFLAELLASNGFARADRARGRFRTFLLSAFIHYLAKDHRDRNALKRGGGKVFSLEAEAGFVPEPADPMTPEAHYERSWAFALLDRLLLRLRDEYTRAGRQPLFEALQPHLTGATGRPGYARLAAQLCMQEGAVSMALHRMRRRYGELLREEVAQTVTDPAEVEDELRHLLRVVAGG